MLLNTGTVKNLNPKKPADISAGFLNAKNNFIN
jgi:hypothetical protein